MFFSVERIFVVAKILYLLTKFHEKILSITDFIKVLPNITAKKSLKNVFL